MKLVALSEYRLTDDSCGYQMKDRKREIGEGKCTRVKS
jgi:hypothetical protein